MICSNISANHSWKACLRSNISLCISLPPHHQCASSPVCGKRTVT